MKSFNGKVAAITGAASGMGRALAVELALEAGVASKTHVLNVLHRLLDGKPRSGQRRPDRGRVDIGCAASGGSRARRGGCRAEPHLCRSLWS